MAIVIGVDEAGYGPRIGPLVISACAFELPDDLAGRSLWQLLAGAVARRPAPRPGRIAIADSKKLYHGRGQDTVERLERGVLTLLAANDDRPRTLRGLLDLLTPGIAGRLTAYPWYEGADLSLPVAATDPPPDARRLRRALARHGARLHLLASEVVLAGEFNADLAATGNKARVLFNATRRLLSRCWDAIPPGVPIVIHVDRQGGRRRYCDGLPAWIDGAEATPLDERRRCSAYRLSDATRRAEVFFTVRAEDRQLPVALASMTSKYVRELLLDLVNRFWASHLPGLRPTAGYYADGARFYREIEPTLRSRRWDPAWIYRAR